MRHPTSHTLLFPLDRHGLSKTALRKGILSIPQRTLRQRISGTAPISPRLFSLLLLIVPLTRGSLSIHDHLRCLGVSLTGEKHLRTGILQHRQQEGNDVTMGIKIFHGAKHTRPLPLPTLSLLGIIQAMARPHRNVTILQTLLHRIRTGKRGDQTGTDNLLREASFFVSLFHLGIFGNQRFDGGSTSH